MSGLTIIKDGKFMINSSDHWDHWETIFQIRIGSRLSVHDRAFEQKVQIDKIERYIKWSVFWNRTVIAVKMYFEYCLILILIHNLVTQKK